jgi:tetratricopeptide (TPR) repeat protein
MDRPLSAFIGLHVGAAVFLVVLAPLTFRKLEGNSLDVWFAWTILLVGATIGLSSYPRGSLYFAFRLAECTALYLCYRTAWRNLDSIRWIAFPFVASLVLCGISEISNRPTLGTLRPWTIQLFLTFMMCLYVRVKDGGMVPSKKWLYNACCTLALVLALAARSRALILSFLAAGVTYALAGTGLNKKIGLCLLLILALLLSASLALYHPERSRRSDSGRLALWSRALAMWQGHPWIGAGSGTFAIENSIRPETTFRPYSGQAQSLWMQTLAERGVVGLVCVLGWLIILAFPPQFTNTGVDRHEWAARLACATGVCVHESFHTTIFYRWDATLLLCLFSGCVYLPSTKRAQARATLTVIVVAVVAITAYYGGIVVAETRGGAATDLQWHPQNASRDGLLAVDEVRAMGDRFSPLIVFRSSRDLLAEDRGRIGHAFDHVVMAIRANPRDAAWYHDLGWLNVAIGDNSRAAAAFLQARDLDVTDSVYWIACGLLSERNADTASSVSNYARAIALNPEILSSRMMEDLAYRNPAIHARASEEALTEIEWQVESTSDPIARARLGALLLHRRCWSRAVLTLQESVRELPSLPRAWANLGVAYAMLLRRADAEMALQRALTLSPREPKAQMLRITWGSDRSLPGDHLLGLMRMPSEHYRRSLRMYPDAPSIPDDVFPNGMLAYVSERISRDLARLFP